jgi:cell wall-associated NlpC family hydrolase/uncharacterized protein YgiM (DUF1202 family)
MRKPILTMGLALSLGLAVAPVSSTLAASSSGTHSPTNSSQTPPSSSSSSSFTPAVRTTNSVSGAAIVAEAYKYLGDAYSYTGDTPATGFSCIGFASYVYHQLGIPLPGDLAHAMAYAPAVPFSDLEPGDLLFFTQTMIGWPGLSHVAIYIGNGEFIHSEWFGKGVRITSFENDPSDGNYWIQHYLGANRPWGGPVTAPPAPPTSSSTHASSTTALPSTVSTTSVTTGSTAIVTVPSLNVRRLPSKTKPVATVIGEGTTVTVLHHGTSWSKVELADGTIGYVVNVGIGGTSGSATATASSGAVVTVSQPTAPARVGQVSTATSTSLPSVRSTVAGLNVHSAPGVGARVITSVPAGTTMTVLKRRGRWLKVELSTGQIGWVSASYARSTTSATKTTTTKTTDTTRTGVASKVTATHPTRTTSSTTTAVSRATEGVNVRTKPSLRGIVVTVLAPKSGYTVLKWSHGWAQVRLADGTTGWVSGSALGISPGTTPAVTQTTRAATTTTTTTTTSSSTTAATTARKTLGAGPNVVTVGVKVHTKPSLRATVETVLPAGTHVTVLGERGNWKLVRLASGTTGYIYASYVR